jgi:hypothetical protein
MRKRIHEGIRSGRSAKAFAETGIVATDGGQGCETKADAPSTLEKVISGHYHGLIKELD